MEIRINIDEKVLFILLIVASLVSAIGITMAAPPDPGHSWTEIECSGCISGGNIAAGAVDYSKVNFNYAGSSFKGGPASSVAWGSITGIPSELSDGDQVGLTQACSWTGWSPTCTVCSGLTCQGTTYSLTQLKCQNGVLTEAQRIDNCCTGTCYNYF